MSGIIVIEVNTPVFVSFILIFLLSLYLNWYDEQYIAFLEKDIKKRLLEDKVYQNKLHEVLFI